MFMSHLLPLRFYRWTFGARLLLVLAEIRAPPPANGGFFAALAFPTCTISLVHVLMISSNDFSSPV